MKKNIISIFFCGAVAFQFAACTKDLDNLKPTGTNTAVVTTATTMLVNEYIASGSTQSNEYGTPSDWFEIYNPGSTDMQIDDSTIYVTNDSLVKNKFLLQASAISPKGFMIIWCDGLNKTTSQIHSNFKLSASGSFIGIFKKNADKTYTLLDSRLYQAQAAAQSEGRSPDGSSNWATFGTPTPGASNN